MKEYLIIEEEIFCSLFVFFLYIYNYQNEDTVTENRKYLILGES